VDLAAASLSYLPIAVGLGALHALEPGHAKTMTAAYLIGTRGTWTDAILLGSAAALTHSLVVIAIAVTALFIGREAFAGEAIWWLQIGSGVMVIALGGWLLWRRFRTQFHRRHVHQAAGHEDHDPHGHHHDHDHDHEDLDDDAHACAHAAQMPAYVAAGIRPPWWQVVAFGAAGGLVPCPASISVMLLALSVGSTVNGLVLVFGFSLGLALALVGVGLVVVTGVSRLGKGGRFAALSRHVPVISAAVIVLSGVIAVVLGLNGHGSHALTTVGGTH